MMGLHFLFRETALNWRRNFSTQVSTLVVLSSAFTVVFTLFTGLTHLESLLTFWGKNIQITAFLDDEVPPAQIATLIHEIGRLGPFDKVRKVEKGEARDRFFSQMPGFSKDIIEEGDLNNPFPASIEIGGLSQDQVARIPALAGSVAKMAGVEDVSYGQEWVENFSGVLRIVSRWGTFMIATLILACVLVTSNSIRIGLSHRREEIEILELVGASQRMIRLPFLFDGAVLGLAAAAIALIGQTALLAAAKSFLSGDLGFLGVSEFLGSSSSGEMITLLSFGLLCGTIGSYICVRKINTGWAAAEVGGTS